MNCFRCKGMIVLDPSVLNGLDITLSKAYAQCEGEVADRIKEYIALLNSMPVNRDD